MDALGYLPVAGDTDKQKRIKGGWMIVWSSITALEQLQCRNEERKQEAIALLHQAGQAFEESV